MDTRPAILLVDDNPLWLQTLADFLRSKDLPSLTASDAQTGLALMEAHDLPLALIDLHMPNMDGLEMLKQLRQRRSSVAVLLLSSDDEPATVSRALAAGAWGLVPKTAAPETLLREVYRLLEAVTSAKRADQFLLRYQNQLPAPPRPAALLSNACRVLH